MVRDARSDIERRARDADAVACAILKLSPEWMDAALPALGTAMAEQTMFEPPVAAPDVVEPREEAEWDPLASIVYVAAVAKFRAGQIGSAVALLATHMLGPAAEADALTGLAICAVQLGKIREALILATACTKMPVKHPRAFCIAGYCELELGNRKTAQTLLALAARMARQRPEFREDLRAAQRLLLILHYA
jgi:hypothetical protein